MRPKINVTLEAACGAVGTAEFLPDDTLGPVTWKDGIEPEGETTRVTFAIVEPVEWADTEEIDGDDWRSLEAEDSLSDIPFFVRHGVGLASAVEAALQNWDPEDFNRDMARDIDDLKELVAGLAEYAGRYADLNDEPAEGHCRLLLKRADDWTN